MKKIVLFQFGHWSKKINYTHSSSSYSKENSQNITWSLIIYLIHPSNNTWLQTIQEQEETCSEFLSSKGSTLSDTMSEDFELKPNKITVRKLNTRNFSWPQEQHLNTERRPPKLFLNKSPHIWEGKIDLARWSNHNSCLFPLIPSSFHSSRNKLLFI